MNVLDPDCTEAKFTLDVSFDPEKADDNDIQTVYSSSLETEDLVSLVNEDIILTKITTGQSLKLEATSEMGSGFEHSKWSPCCGTSFELNDDGSYRFKIETTGALEPEETFKKSIRHLQEKLDKFQNF